MSDLEKIILKDVEIRWAHLKEPATRGEYASNKYEVTVIMDKAEAEKVKLLANPAQDIKKTEEGMYSIVLRSSIKPKVLNKDKTVVSDDVLGTIGNGTIAHVCAKQYKGFKDKVFLGLSSIMLVDIKEYVADDFGDIEVDDELV